MLHFVIGLAVCIWIAERVTHWLHGRRYRKLVARMLSTTPAAPYEQQPGSGVGLAVALSAGAVGVFLIAAFLVAH